MAWAYSYWQGTLRSKDRSQADRDLKRRKQISWVAGDSDTSWSDTSIRAEMPGSAEALDREQLSPVRHNREKQKTAVRLTKEQLSGLINREQLNGRTLEQVYGRPREKLVSRSQSYSRSKENHPGKGHAREELKKAALYGRRAEEAAWDYRNRVGLTGGYSSDSSDSFAEDRHTQTNNGNIHHHHHQQQLYQQHHHQQQHLHHQQHHPNRNHHQQQQQQIQKKQPEYYPSPELPLVGGGVGGLEEMAWAHRSGVMEEVVRRVGAAVRGRRRVVLLGLDGAGKTTVLMRLKHNAHLHTTPTLAFNHEKVRGGGYRWEVWDVGGGERLRPLWYTYVRGTDALVFVVNSAAPQDSLEEARVELARILKVCRVSAVQQRTPPPPLLVLANQQDVPGALNASSVAVALDLEEAGQGMVWGVAPVCAVTGRGLHVAMASLRTLIDRAKAEGRRKRRL
ncbi:uncharacterized protein LOC143039463 [Oratosquilla oratoria]|uniref:uncharacterized protein LOC143039463 n=1 Tax=Oratosquilla oratoria TaxID=337810 RepID=UPI003F7651AE